LDAVWGEGKVDLIASNNELLSLFGLLFRKLLFFWRAIDLSLHILRVDI